MLTLAEILGDMEKLLIALIVVLCATLALSLPLNEERDSEVQ